MTLKELRKQNGLTQTQAAQLVGIPFRTYIRYEGEFAGKDSFKSQMIFNTLKEKTTIDEERGILTIERIKERVVPILRKHKISFCYLFGSYAKGCPKATSDIDLLVDSSLKGLRFFALLEDVKEALGEKDVDLFDVTHIEAGSKIQNEINNTGIKIYERY